MTVIREKLFRSFGLINIKTVSIIGFGAIGCTIYPSLSRFLGKEKVRIIAGGERAARLKEKGVVINGMSYSLNVVSPEEKGSPADLVIFAVKYYHLNRAMGDMKNQIGPDTTILSLMNGITSEEEIGAVYGMEKVLYSFTSINSQYDKGVAAFTMGNNSLSIGTIDKDSQSEKLDRVKHLFDSSGLPCEIPEDIIRALWLKFLLNVGGNPVASVLRARHIHFQKLESANRARLAVMKEIIALSKAMGTGLVDEDLAVMGRIYDNYSPEGRGSMVQDILAGRKTENEMLCGTAVRLGKEYAIPMPVNEFLYHLIGAIEDENAGLLES